MAQSSAARVESNAPSTGGITGNGFKPGKSGNPGGRPKGLARLAREATGGDGRLLVEFYVRVYQDEDEKTETRLKAAEWLADRGFGKAVDVKAQDEGDDPLGIHDARERLAKKLENVVRLEDAKSNGAESASNPEKSEDSA